MVSAVEDWMPRHRITVHEYYRMEELGLLAPEARVELIEGAIVDRAPIGSLHSSVVADLDRLFQRAVGDAALVLVQAPIRLSDYSEPQPDLALVRARADRYRNGHPGPSDTLLVVEVSLTTLRYDRQVKGPLYARHGVPEVWLVDLQSGQVTFFRMPSDGDYANVTSTDRPGITPIGALPGVSVDISGVLSERFDAVTAEGRYRAFRRPP